MSEMRNNLDDEVLDFVLKDDKPGAGAPPGQQDLTATIRGDLGHVNLPDIFQTITMSRMLGTLRVSSGWEPTYVHFAGDKIRVLPPHERQVRRLGRRLVASGLMEAKDVRAALVRHRREGGDLGTILEEGGKVEKVQFEAIRLALEEDSLLELFTLRHGTFSFFRDSYPLPGLEERFAACVEFEADQILLEIARRSDEWSRILEVLGDLDEVLVPTGRTAADDIGEVEADLYGLIDGKRTLRDIAGGMLDSLFDVAKAAQHLYENGSIEKAPAYHLISLARTAIAAQHPRLCHQYLDLIRDGREPSLEEQEEVADLLVVAGDPRGGADVLAATASKVADRARKLEILGRARDLDGLNRAVLELLVETLRNDTGLEQSPEYEEAVLQLSEVLVDAEDYDAALALVTDVEVQHPDDLALVSRKARILLRMDRKSEAFAALSELAKSFRLQGDTGRLIKTLEQILRLDPRESRARSELRSLLESKGVKRARKLAAILVVALVVRIGWIFVASYWADVSGRQQLAEAEHLVDTGKLDEGQRIAQEVAQRLGDSDVAGMAWTLIARIKARRESAERRRHRVALDAVRAGLDKAVARLEAHDYAAALDDYAKLLRKYAGSKEYRQRVKSSLNARFGSLATALAEEVARAEASSLPPIEKAETPGERTTLYGRLVRRFPDAKLVALAELDDLVAREGRLAKLDGLPPKFLATLTRYLELGAATRAKRDALARRIEEDRRKARLNEPFLRAQQAEADRDFREAYKQFKKLAAAYEGDEATAQVFRDKRDYYASIIREVDLLEKATARGDYEEAARRYRVLEETDPNIRFAEVVELPLRIRTDPPGADVVNHGRVAGRTPLLFRYKPGSRLDLRLELRGFGEIKVPKDAEGDGRFHAVLELQPVWERKLDGALTRCIAWDPDTDSLVVADRSGTVWAFSLRDQKERFHRKLDDLSGDLGTPFVLAGRILLPARDGHLRCFDVRTGKALWTKETGLRLLSPCIPAGDDVWVASEDGSLRRVSIEDGRVLQRIRHAGPLRHPPVAGAAGGLCYVDREGTIVWCAADGTLRRKERLPKAGWIRPVLGGTRLLVPVEDGTLHVFAGPGPAWTVDLGDALREPPLVAGDRAFAATGRKELLEIDLVTRKITRRVPLPGRPSGPVAAVGRVLFVPIEGQGARAFRLDGLTPYCRVSSDLTTELPLQAAGSRFFAFESTRGVLRLYDRAMLGLR